MSKRVTISQGEGQVITRVASAFGVNDNFAKEMKLNGADKSMAIQDVVRLYRVLKKASPLMKKNLGTILFGPADSWDEHEVKSGNDGEPTKAHKMKDECLEVQIRLNTEAFSGLRWVLLAMMHPASGLTMNVDTQEKYGWPVIEKASLVKQITKDLGINDAKREALELDDADFEEGEDAEFEDEPASEPNLTAVT